MSGWKKLASAAAGGEALNVEDVFSTYLYEGTDSSQTITNGIDLGGEGGLVWIKSRGSTENHWLFDNERSTYGLASNEANQQSNFSSTGVTSLNSDGFTMGGNSKINGSVEGPFASWSFRKTPKFFDVVTYSGSSSAQTISHSLGVVPAVIIVKQLNSSGRWTVYHKDASPTGNPENGRLALNTTDAWAEYPAVSSFQNLWDLTAPTSTHFTVGTDATTGASGSDYVAYLFAHNDGDGEFGGTEDQDIIKCGSYTGNGSTDGPKITLGFEPQFIMVKRTDSTSNWRMYDVMRELSHNDAEILTANSTAAESNYGGISPFLPLADGFKNNYNDGGENASGGTYIYIAIRRGPMALPESGDDVFETATRDATKPSFDSGWPVDMAVYYNNITTLHSKYLGSRMQGIWIMSPSSSGAEQDLSAFKWDYMDGYYDTTGTSANYISHMWRRYPQCFDVVCYTGNGTTGRTINHNLEVAPEMMWVKKRSGSGNWQVYHASQGAGKYSPSFRTDPFYSAGTSRWNNTTPTSSVFTLGSDNDVNGSGNDYVAYLFASLDGVTKLGSYSGTGSNINVDCGFSNGAKFIMIKRADTEIQSTTHWYVWDSLHGIVAGNDPYLMWNNVTAQVTNTDYIDPYSSGFTITSSANSGLNASGGTYIFYAVAA